MIRTVVATLAAVLVTATINAQQYPQVSGPCDPLPPPGTFTSGDFLTVEDGYRFELGTRYDVGAEVRQVSGGIILNWIGGEPSWALRPVPDAFYAAENMYGAYCRHFSAGADKTAQTGCRTDCVIWWGGNFYYTVAAWESRGEWRIVTAEKLPQR